MAMDPRKPSKKETKMKVQTGISTKYEKIEKIHRQAVLRVHLRQETCKSRALKRNLKRMVQEL